MKRSFSLKILVCLLAFLTVCSLFAACGEKPAETTAPTEETVKKYKAIICVDGATYEIADAKGKTVVQLLEEAKISLKEGDVVSIDGGWVISDEVLIRIFTMKTVSFQIQGEDGQILAHYTVSSTADTVAEAMKIAGIQLSENQELSAPENASLQDGMKITVSVKKEEAPEETKPEETKPEETVSTEPSWGSGAYEPAPTQPTAPETQPTVPTVPPTEPTAPPTEAPTAPPETEVTVISEEYYYDPDGSGHGVKIITYSDGTQEEIEF